VQGHQILNIKLWQRRPWTLRLPNHLFKMKVNLKLTSKVISSILLLLPLLWKITANNWFSRRQIKKSTWIYFIIRIQMSWWMKVIKMRMIRLQILKKMGENLVIYKMRWSDKNRIWWQNQKRKMRNTETMINLPRLKAMKTRILMQRKIKIRKKTKKSNRIRTMNLNLKKILKIAVTIWEVI
jgi:hypothetical protein